MTREQEERKVKERDRETQQLGTCRRRVTAKVQDLSERGSQIRKKKKKAERKRKRLLLTL